MGRIRIKMLPRKERYHHKKMFTVYQWPLSLSKIYQSCLSSLVLIMSRIASGIICLSHVNARSPLSFVCNLNLFAAELFLPTFWSRIYLPMARMQPNTLIIGKSSATGKWYKYLNGTLQLNMFAISACVIQSVIIRA